MSAPRSPDAVDTVVLDFDDRHRRRIAMKGIRGLDFTLDLPESGAWEELLNSDALAYGGSGVGNLGTVHADDNGRATMVLPPLGVLWLGHRA